MALYLVVRHRLAKQVWNNAWRPGSDHLLDAITTTAQIGRRCESARAEHADVFVHRTGWGDALICCAVQIESVRLLPSGADALVTFKDVRPVLKPPADRRLQGDDFYEGPAPAA